MTLRIPETIKKGQKNENPFFEILHIDYGGSWSLFTRFLAKIFYLIQLLLTTNPIESLDSLNRAQISGQYSNLIAPVIDMLYIILYRLYCSHSGQK